MEETRIKPRPMMAGGETPDGVISDRMADERIIESCRQGDRAAFQTLFETYQDRVYSIALHFSGNEASAKDITQQVFLKLFTRIEQFRHEAEFTTWLYRLVVNVCLDEQRKAKRFLFFGEVSAAPDKLKKISQEDCCLRYELEASVKTAITNLKPKLRMAILLKYFEDLSYDEIAEVLGVSKGTVASRLNRGHKILAHRLAYLRDQLFPGK